MDRRERRSYRRRARPARPTPWRSGGRWQSDWPRRLWFSDIASPAEEVVEPDCDPLVGHDAALKDEGPEYAHVVHGVRSSEPNRPHRWAWRVTSAPARGAPAGWERWWTARPALSVQKSTGPSGGRSSGLTAARRPLSADTDAHIRLRPRSGCGRSARVPGDMW